jgi:hypothetical protein
MSAYIRKSERSQINNLSNLMMLPKALEKKQAKPKTSIRKEIKIQAEIYKLESKKIERISELKC